MNARQRREMREAQKAAVVRALVDLTDAVKELLFCECGEKDECPVHGKGNGNG